MRVSRAGDLLLFVQQAGEAREHARLRGLVAALARIGERTSIAELSGGLQPLAALGVSGREPSFGAELRVGGRIGHALELGEREHRETLLQPQAAAGEPRACEQLWRDGRIFFRDLGSIGQCGAGG